MGLFTCWAALRVWQPFNSTRPGSQVPSFGRSWILLGAIITIHALHALLWRRIEGPRGRCGELERLPPIMAMHQFVDFHQQFHIQIHNVTTGVNVCISKRLLLRNVEISASGNINFTSCILWDCHYFQRANNVWIEVRVKWSTFNDFQREREERVSIMPNRCFSNFWVFIA